MGRKIAVILCLLGVCLILPLVSQAQERTMLFRVGLLMHDGTPPGFLEAFRTGLKELGYVEGKNLVLELRNAEGNNEQLVALANELVWLRADVIVALNTPSAIAAKNSTSTIPIVMARVSEPVQSGLVTSLARPGGNLTVLSFNNAALAVKALGLLREALPHVTRVAVLSNAVNPAHQSQVSALLSAAERTRHKLHSTPLQSSSDQVAAFQSAAGWGAQAVFVLDDTSLTKQREEIVKLAAAQSLPVISRYADFAEAGALLTYGPTCRRFTDEPPSTSTNFCGAPRRANFLLKSRPCLSS